MKLTDLTLALIAALACLATASFGSESESKELSDNEQNEMEMLEREIRSLSPKSKRNEENSPKPPRRRNRNKGRGKNKNKSRRRKNRQRKTTVKRRRPARATPTPPRPQQQALDDDETYLEKFGYLAKTRTPNVQHSPAARREAIKNYQRFNHLKVTGLLDAATRKLMAKPRCGLPDMIPAGVNPGEESLRNPGRNPEKYWVPGFKWKKNRLTWLARNYSPDLPSGKQRLAFYQAFRHWSKVAPLEFNEIGGGDPDIEIKFASWEHGDGPQNSFDGRGGTLAHAYFPENGDTHFDESETWTERTREGTNLMIVAAHEFGHALGLGHSNVRGALMAPYYQGYDPNFKLHEDDILAIQSLYGSRPRPTPKPTTPPAPPKVPTTSSPRPRITRQPPVTRRTTRKPPAPRTTPKAPAPGAPDKCTMKYDAVVQAHDHRIYIFRGKYIFSTSPGGILEPGYPKLIKERFQRPPSNIGSAVYSWRTRRTYFFKGMYVWKYYGFKREAKVRMSGSYPKHPHAALMGRDGRIYLLKKDKYYIFDEYQMATLALGPRRIAGLWPGIPNNIEAAVRLNDGYVYFFKGTRYRKYDEVARRVLPGYPKEKAAPWMGPHCSKGGKIIPK